MSTLLMFSILFQHKKLYHLQDDNKCFPSYYIDDWNYYFEQCVNVSSFSVKFNV